MPIDLDKPWFTQRQLLELVPQLTAKNLQNWIERGLMDTGGQKPGKAGRLYYTPLAAVLLTFVTEVVSLGVRPSSAFEMAEWLDARVRELWANKPEEFPESPEEPVSVKTWRLEVYRRAYVYRGEGGHHVWIEAEAPEVRTERLWLLPSVYIAVEIDLLSLRVLKRAQRLMAGLPANFPKPGETA